VDRFLRLHFADSWQALWRDVSKITTYRGGAISKSTIDIYSCAGKLISQLNWDKGSIRGIGWSDDERLLVVSEDGTVRCYSGLHGDFHPFSLGHDSESIHAASIQPDSSHSSPITL
jgi:WD40 repeat protein